MKKLYAMLLRITSKRPTFILGTLSLVTVAFVLWMLNWWLAEDATRLTLVLQDPIASISALAIVMLTVGLLVTGETQAGVAYKSSLHARYCKAIELFVSGNQLLRKEGIRSLQEMAKDDPGSYNIRVMQLFNDHLRRIWEEDAGSFRWYNRKTGEVADIMKAIGSRKYVTVKAEIANGFAIDLTDIDFSGLDFSGLNLANIDFSRGNLNGANLTNVVLAGSIFSGSKLKKAILSGTRFCKRGLNAKGLEQTQLDTAEYTLPGPYFDRVEDATTGEAISWTKHPKSDTPDQP